MPEPKPVTWLDDLLAALPQLRIAVCGDFALDAYWDLANDHDEVSIETGKPVQQVREQRYSLGGAGNVAANLVDLGVGRVEAIGVVGRDLFGEALRGSLATLSVTTDNLLDHDPRWQTLVYAKPQVNGIEQNRLDFGTNNTLTPEQLGQLGSRLHSAALRCDALIVNQQVLRGVVTPALIEAIGSVRRDHPNCPILVDSRHHGKLLPSVIRKLNRAEAQSLVAGEAQLTTDELARELHAKHGQPVFLTCGEAGVVVAAEGQLHQVAGIPRPGRVDPVGAGDTMVAALAAAIAAGRDAVTAAEFGNLAAAVTVTKLGHTGTAQPAEVLALEHNRDRR